MTLSEEAWSLAELLKVLQGEYNDGAGTTIRPGWWTFGRAVSSAVRLARDLSLVEELEGEALATVIEDAHDTVIVEHLSRKEVKRIEGHHGLAATLRDFAREQGCDPDDVKSTSFGVRWQHPNGIGYRATYARKKGRSR